MSPGNVQHLYHGGTGVSKDSSEDGGPHCGKRGRSGRWGRRHLVAKVLPWTGELHPWVYAGEAQQELVQLAEAKFGRLFCARLIK